MLQPVSSESFFSRIRGVLPIAGVGVSYAVEVPVVDGYGCIYTFREAVGEALGLGYPDIVGGC